MQFVGFYYEKKAVILLKFFEGK